MSWQVIHVRRDSGNFLHLVEQPIANHLAEELNKIEAEGKNVTYIFDLSSSEDHVQAIVRVEDKNDPS